MATVTAGQSATITIPAGTAWSVTTTGEAQVFLVAGRTGAGYTSWRVTPDRPLAIAPFDAGGVIRMVGVSGSSTDAARSPETLTAAEVAQLRPLVSEDGVYGVTNLAGLRRWRRRYADALYGGAPKVVVLGDSTTYGTGCAGTGSETDAQCEQFSAPAQLRTRFAALLNSNEGGYIHARQGGAVVAANTGTVVNSIGLGGYVHSINNTGPGTLTFTIPKCKYVELVYYENNSPTYTWITGAFSYNLDGAGAVAVGAPSVANKYTSVVLTVSDATAASHTLVVTGTAANSARICGVWYYSDAGVAVARVGRPGWTLADIFGWGYQNLVTDAFRRERTITSLLSAGPALYIMPLSINDFSRQSQGPNIDNGSGQQYTTPEYLSRQIDLCMAQINAAGGCLLLVGPGETQTAEQDAPGFGASPFGLKTWDQYLAMLKAKAAAGSNIAYMSFTGRWGGYTQANTDGLMYNASHPTRRGYGDQAAAWLNVLTAA